MQAAAANATSLSLLAHSLPRSASSACAMAIARAAPRVERLHMMAEGGSMASCITAALLQASAGRLVSLRVEKSDRRWGEDEYTALARCTRLTELWLGTIAAGGDAGWAVCMRAAAGRAVHCNALHGRAAAGHGGMQEAAATGWCCRGQSAVLDV